MRLRNVTGSRETIAGSGYVVHEPEQRKGKWKEEFGNNYPIRLEIGMGKGKFLMELAGKNSQINYIGIEKYSTVLLRAVQKMERDPLPNVRLIRMDAEHITEVFAENEIDRIYLNFSDPWPKDRHAGRRLPSRQFLARYDQILKRGGTIEFKTDNSDLFAFAEEELEDSQWKIVQITHDLHADEEMRKDNVMTEYEERFSSMGNPIHKYIIQKI